jgi:hypothetical protein
MYQFRIQSGPPSPKCVYIRVMLSSRKYPAVSTKMPRIIVNTSSRVAARSVHFLLPAARELRTAITAHEITHIIKINLNVARDNVTFFSC